MAFGNVAGPQPENLNEMLDLIVETSRDKNEVAFEDLLKALGLLFNGLVL